MVGADPDPGDPPDFPRNPPGARLPVLTLSGVGDGRGERQGDAHAEPAARAILQPDRAAVALGDRAHHGKAESAAAGIAAARPFDSEERVEHPLPERLRDAGPAVVDQYLDPPLVQPPQGCSRLPAVAQGIVEQVLEELPRVPFTGCCTKRGDALITVIGSIPVAILGGTVTGTAFPRIPSSSFRTTTAAMATTARGITTTAATATTAPGITSTDTIDTMATTVPGTGITTTALAMATKAPGTATRAPGITANTVGVLPWR